MTHPIDTFMATAELAAVLRRKEVSPVGVTDCPLELVQPSGDRRPQVI